jgi:hypothetical protein
LDYESPYEAKFKEYEQRLAVIDKELLGKTEEAEELVDAETEELPLQRAFRSSVNPRKAKSTLQRNPSKTDQQPRLPSKMSQAKPSKSQRCRLRASRDGKQPIEDAKHSVAKGVPISSGGRMQTMMPGYKSVRQFLHCFYRFLKKSLVSRP